MSLEKIISGGQTGVDRGALDAALSWGFPCGGWCPGDRSAEDGVIDDRYPLVPLPEGGYRRRTRLNVVDSDGTAIIYTEALSGGTGFTLNLCALENRPYVLVDALEFTASEAVDAIMTFVHNNQIRVLNVAGPRASKWAGGYEFTKAVLAGVIAQRREGFSGLNRTPVQP